MIETLPVKAAADLIGRAPNTLRTWSGEDHFGPYLSPFANPEKGKERRFTERDIRLLRTVVILQKQGLSIGEIIPRIAAGEILEELPEELPAPSRQSPQLDQEPPEGRALVTPRDNVPAQLELFIRPYEIQIAQFRSDLDRERARLEAEQKARLEAELELSRLRAQIEERARPWYKRLTRS